MMLIMSSIFDLPMFIGVGGGVGDNREDDNPNLPTQTGGGGFDEPPG